jgi:hypothetical protein
VSSPLSSPLSFGQYLLDTSPITALSVPPVVLPDYLRAIARLYVTELRPMWRPNWLGEKHGCAGSVLASPAEGNKVLLAKLTLTIEPDGLGSPIWKVTGPPSITEDTRPFLLHLRLLQEWLLTQSAVGGPTVVAAGIIKADAPSIRSVFNGLKAVSLGGGGLRLSFDGYAQPPPVGGPQYVVKALPWSDAALTVTFGGFQPSGLKLSVWSGGSPLPDAQLSGLQLLVEVTQVG